MSTGSDYLNVSGINVDVVYKDIKNLHISVYPPVGRVRVAAPLQMAEDSIRLAIVQRLSWIRKQQEQLLSADRLSEREMVSGESHFLWGQRLRLRVIESGEKVTISRNGEKLEMYVPPETNKEIRRELLDDWYRLQLRTAISDLLPKWELATGLSVHRWTVRRMKTKWGSCNPETKNIWFNLELAKKHPSCLEYIAIHEMAHFQERTHNEKFVRLMDGFLPNWRSVRDQLNSEPLKAESWNETKSTSK